MLNRVNLLVQIVRYLLICCIVSSRSSLISLGREFCRTRLFIVTRAFVHQPAPFDFLHFRFILFGRKIFGKSENIHGAFLTESFAISWDHILTENVRYSREKW